MEHAERLAAELDKLPDAEAAFAAAAKKTEDAQAKLTKVLKPLQEAAYAAGAELQEADANLRALRPHVAQAVGLWRDHQELLPSESAPDAVRKIWEQERQKQAADQAKRDALRKFADAQRKCDRLEQLLHTMRFGGPLGAPPSGANVIFDPELARRDLPAAIEAAETQLVSAKEELAEARTGAATLGSDMTKT